MERLVALMCWLFNGEQHLERKEGELEENKHEVVEVSIALKKKKRERGRSDVKVVVDRWGLDTFM